MIKYANGFISKNILPNETVLRIILSNEGQDLSSVFENILKEYSRYITCIELCGGEESMFEVADLLRSVKKSGLHTSWVTSLNNESQINKRLDDELDYLGLNATYMKKDYSPFGDEVVWINL